MWPCPPARRVPHLPPSSATGCRSKLSLLHSSRYSTAREPGLPLPFSSTFDSRELQQQKRGRPVWGRVDIFLSNHQQRLQQAGRQAGKAQAGLSSTSAAQQQQQQQKWSIQQAVQAAGLTLAGRRAAAAAGSRAAHTALGLPPAAQQQYSTSAQSSWRLLAPTLKAVSPQASQPSSQPTRMGHPASHPPG
jgi:hypothetical protein